MSFEEVTIGDCRLILGDCLEVLPTIGNADAVITDPPYELPNKFGTSNLYGRRVMEFHFDVENITDECVIPALKIAFSKVSAFHSFCGTEQYAGIAKVARELGFTAKPWAKIKLCPPPPMPGNWWPSAFELAIYGYKRGAYFGDDSPNRKNIMVFDSYRKGIRAEEKENHPTQKWLPMVNYLVQSVVPPGGVAIDPFMGSGTTGHSCLLLGRKFIGIERERKYFDIACRRIEQAYAQGRLFDEPVRKPEQESLF